MENKELCTMTFNGIVTLPKEDADKFRNEIAEILNKYSISIGVDKLHAGMCGKPTDYSESVDGYRVGDVCRFKDQEDLWVLTGIGSRSYVKYTKDCFLFFGRSLTSDDIEEVRLLRHISDEKEFLKKVNSLRESFGNRILNRRYSTEAHSFIGFVKETQFGEDYCTKVDYIDPIDMAIVNTYITR